MVNTLNTFAFALLEKISDGYPFLKSHIPLLKIESRRATGVGLFVHFKYQRSIHNYDQIPTHYSALSSNSVLHIDGLEYPLSYEIAITDGQIDFLEVVTNGNESWDGAINNFWLE